jgi:hypothetical protein
VVYTDRVCRQLGATSSIPFSQTLSGSDYILLTAWLRGDMLANWPWPLM